LVLGLDFPPSRPDPNGRIMPIRIPTGSSAEAWTYGIAGIGAFAPLYMLLPGATERLATRTSRWAPRWEKNISYFIPSFKWGINKMTPPVERTVSRFERRVQPRLERAVQGMSRRLERKFEYLKAYRTEKVAAVATVAQ
jgi:hypothetical protein